MSGVILCAEDFKRWGVCVCVFLIEICFTSVFIILKLLLKVEMILNLISSANYFEVVIGLFCISSI